MNDLIEALQIFAKYMEGVDFPTTTAHDTLYVCVNEELVSKEDETRLEELGFFPADEGGYMSFRFGSC